MNWMSAFGPLEPLMADPSVTEVLVDAPGHVYVERGGRLEDAPVAFESPAALRAAIESLLALGGRPLEPGASVGDARLPDESLVLAVLPPAAIDGPHLVIRKFQAQPVSWERLIELKALSGEALDFLKRALAAGASMALAGTAGSGRTTVANLLAGAIDPSRRLVIVEQSHELRVSHPRAVRLEAGPGGAAAFAALIETAARLRPDWLVIGELRGAETMAALQILGAGHPGLVTMAAANAEDALRRLETQCLMANYGLGLADIRAMIAAALGLVVTQARLPGGARRLTQIAEIRLGEHDRLLLQPMFRYDPASDALIATGARASWE